MSLDDLRNKLAALDRDILELVAERQRLSSEIGAEKRSRGIPPRDYGQEKEVIQRARDAAAAQGLPAEVAEALTLLLIRSSLTVQERDQVAAREAGSGKRILIIGGGGKMGRWFVRFLSSQGYVVETADPSGPVAGCRHYDDWRDADLEHDMIVVAAPLRRSAEILLELAEAPPRGLIFDIGSLKSPLRSGLTALARAGARVTSLHPMFGPDVELLSGRHVIVVDAGSPEASEEVKQLFTPTMATVVDMDLENHDRLIAYVLGLSHVVNISFFTALAESGEAAKVLAQLSSTTFDDQLAVASQVAGENPHLYFEIQTLNDYGTESIAALLYAVERVRSVVRAGDEGEFVELMQRGHAYLQDRAERRGRGE